MSQINSTEAQRKFGDLVLGAQREPVEIFSHHKPNVVMIFAHEYARPKARDRRVVPASKLDEETVELVRAAHTPAGAAAFDHEVNWLVSHRPVQPGDVIQYAYLRGHEERQSHVDGRKDRPSAVMVVPFR